MNLKNSKVLITGVAGFLGSHLAEQLLNRGAKVIGVDDLSTGKEENMNSFIDNNNFKFIKNNVNYIESYLEDIDYIFHYSACVGVNYTQDNQSLVLKDIIGIRRIFEMAEKEGIKKIIFASSSEVYGHTTPPFIEGGQVDVRTPYQVVKAIGEQYCLNANIPATALRIFNVFGPRQRDDFVVNKFIKQALNNKDITVYRDGKQTRDLVYIDDNIRLSINALDSKCDNQIINIGRGYPTEIMDLAVKIKFITNSNSFISKDGTKRKDEIKHRWADYTKQSELVGRPKITLTNGLEKTIKYYDRK